LHFFDGQRKFLTEAIRVLKISIVLKFTPQKF